MSDFVRLFDDQIVAFFRDAVRTCIRRPELAGFFIRTVAHQQAAARRRREAAAGGLHVPPLLIASITEQCNLRCRNCYAQAHCRPARAEMPAARWAEVFTEARDLGVSIVMVAGGEPLTRPEVLDVTVRLPGVIFPLFTNGLLLDDAVVGRLVKQRQVIPVLSIEGFERATDDRRGAGVYDTVQAAIGRLERAGVFFGVSLTMTRHNFATVTGDEFIGGLVRAGCRLVILVEYTPVTQDSEDLVLLPDQKAAVEPTRAALAARYPLVCAAFPGDEEQYGGCLAAGRGFVHVGPDGSLEPCPFAPFSDTSVRDRPLRDALGSEFLARVRDGHGQLSESEGGCALWRNRDWVSGLLQGSSRMEGG
jgi:MoaA/NifB/PqqE/SkfB family radical SAM enzyme